VGIGFAVPASTVQNVVSQLLRSGKARHPYVGIYLTDVTSTVAQATGMPVGVEITRVVSGSPADGAGLVGASGHATVAGASFPTGGDVITKLDGVSVRSADDFVARISALKPGREITLTLVRGGQTRTVTVTLGSR
jgi:S1-C subfamily serine protease